MEKKPFFIVGCVRSGTTFLRDVLRRHPNLACPEETHFYRWGEPFGTPAYSKAVLNNRVLAHHRELDGIPETLFRRVLENSVARSDLYRRYMRHYITKTKPGATRWFDKTPQNVYGAALLASEFPGSKFIHVVRHPVDVAASLKIGTIVHVPHIVGACNYWLESIAIMRVIRKAYPRRVHEVRYEDLTAGLGEELARILAFVGEPYEPTMFAGIVSAPKHHDVAELFSAEEREMMEKLCGPMARRYGYSWTAREAGC
jgi:hypothetical protein